MKTTNAQFALVFVGVLLMHLAAAIALMKSAETDSSGTSVAMLDPTYHTRPARETPAGGGGPGSKGKAMNPPSPKVVPDPKTDGSSDEIPDAFAAAAKPPPPSEPVSEPEPAKHRKKPGPETAEGRRLTVTQLLSAEPPPSRVEPPADSGNEPAAPLIPKIKPLPSVGVDTGPRKIRSLNPAN